jgi:hypothetical protein
MSGNPLLPPPPPAREVPILAEVRRRLEIGDSAGAILLAFETAMRDFLAAFGYEPPAFWTYADIFRLGVRTDMGYAPVLLARLYRIYEPVRYGEVRTVPPGDIVETLRQFYDQPALKRAPTLARGATYGAWSPGTTSPEPIGSVRPTTWSSS